MSSKKESLNRPYAQDIGSLPRFGASPENKGYRFTVFSHNATRVWLLLFKKPGDAEPAAEYELDPNTHRFGDIWSIWVPGVKAGQAYVYRMDGPFNHSDLHHFRADQWLLDPYARAVHGHAEWGNTEGLEPGRHLKNGAAFPKAVITASDFDWEDDQQPNIAWNDLVIYETHLRGFTRHDSAQVSSPGTYRGFIEKIPHLKSLGINAVELLPIHEFNEIEYFLDNNKRASLRNYWGYSTLCFFAPQGRFAAGGSGGAQIDEFKELVKALHAEGIEVILDVVFNHTQEGGRKGPTYSFRGLDNAIYYMHNKDGSYKNYTGVGNTVNANHPVVRQFILECLRYWVTEFHIDGFRFDLASALTRDEDGSIMGKPPLIHAMDHDPILRGTKLIAEPWDAAGAYQVHDFPGRHWSLWNGQYRDDVRRFWLGERGMLPKLASRIIGSPDMYLFHDMGTCRSINFITCHDGFTLNDLVSYSHKHNEANMEENQDGENINHSQNFGEEGPTQRRKVQEERRKMQKNMLATLFFSQGVPMMLGGDEFSRTQQGSNNAYCQDNEISWFNWDMLAENKDLLDFTRQLITFRKNHPSLRHTHYLKDQDGTPTGWVPDIQWFPPHGEAIDWQRDRAIALLLNADGVSREKKKELKHLFIVFNGSEQPQDFAMPHHSILNWKAQIATARLARYSPAQGICQVQPRSLVLFTADPAVRRMRNLRKLRAIK